MPAFIAAMGGMLISLVGTLVGRVLIALGISVASFTGMKVLLNSFKENAINALISLPPDVLNMLSMMKVGVSLNIIMSAILTRLLLNGLSGDTIKRWLYS